MKKVLVILLMIPAFSIFLTAQNKFDLPKGAAVIERQPVTTGRRLVLWMLNPQKNPRDPADDVYTCPDYTRGNYYTGQANISLVNTQTGKVINTVEIKDSEGSFDLPYLIQRFYYKVPKIGTKKEGRPMILDLQDFNGDGRASEFAVFDAQACMGLETALFGYSEKQDKVIQYPVELKSGDQMGTVFWTDYLFSKKPVSPGLWKYDIDYRGRGGTLDKYEIRYDRQGEKFTGTLISIEDEK